MDELFDGRMDVTRVCFPRVIRLGGREGGGGGERKLQCGFAKGILKDLPLRSAKRARSYMNAELKAVGFGYESRHQSSPRPPPDIITKCNRREPTG